jgi:hypothetical protein
VGNDSSRSPRPKDDIHAKTLTILASRVRTFSGQGLGGPTEHHRVRSTEVRGSGMTQDVEYFAGGIAHKEAADSPRFVG